MSLDVSHLESATDTPLGVELDEQNIEGITWPEHKRVWLARVEEKWRSIEQPPLSDKGPHRYGPFKEAFNRRMIFVYGTAGTAEENAWSFAKARYDAETFWYRGNGSVDLVSDDSFLKQNDPQRSVIVYGNATSNKAWAALLSDDPVRVVRGAIRVGDRDLEGHDLCTVFVRPRAHSDRALVGCVGGTGIMAMRATTRLRYFVSGVGYPDLLIVSADFLVKGPQAIRAAGYFGIDWSVASGDFAWAEGP